MIHWAPQVPTCFNVEHRSCNLNVLSFIAQASLRHQEYAGRLISFLFPIALLPPTPFCIVFGSCSACGLHLQIQSRSAMRSSAWLTSNSWSDWNVVTKWAAHSGIWSTATYLHCGLHGLFGRHVAHELCSYCWGCLDLWERSRSEQLCEKTPAIHNAWEWTSFQKLSVDVDGICHPLAHAMSSQDDPGITSRS